MLPFFIFTVLPSADRVTSAKILWLYLYYLFSSRISCLAWRMGWVFCLWPLLGDLYFLGDSSLNFQVTSEAEEWMVSASVLMISLRQCSSSSSWSSKTKLVCEDLSVEAISTSGLQLKSCQGASGTICSDPLGSVWKDYAARKSICLEIAQFFSAASKQFTLYCKAWRNWGL